MRIGDNMEFRGERSESPGMEGWTPGNYGERNDNG